MTECGLGAAGWSLLEEATLLLSRPASTGILGRMCICSSVASTFWQVKLPCLGRDYRCSRHETFVDHTRQSVSAIDRGKFTIHDAVCIAGPVSVSSLDRSVLKS